MQKIINDINNFIKNQKWIDIEFKTINHNEITLRCGEDIDLPQSGHRLITFTNPSFIKSDLWIRSTLEETASSNFSSIVPAEVSEKIMGRKLDKENKERNLPAEILFKIQTGDNEYSYIAAENVVFKIIN